MNHQVEKLDDLGLETEPLLLRRRVHRLNLLPCVNSFRCSWRPVKAGSQRSEKDAILASAGQFGGGDGQVAYAPPGRVVNGVGDGGRGAHDAELTDALGAHRVEVGV